MSTNNSNNKTIIYSFDGTGNEPSDADKIVEDESISNILKLHILMGGGFSRDKSRTKTPNGNDQITHYYNGIGTQENGEQIPLVGSLVSKASEWLNLTLAPSWADAGRILREAKKDFDSSYECGDKVCVFGFSRGAALARKFVSEILKDNSRSVVFLGVFDTVAAMDGIHRKSDKLSTDVVFENGTLNDRVERAVHIVSLDENRIAFAPTLINKDVKNSNRILEIWFPGVHSDIGGGYWFDGLSDSALQFMICQCKKTLGKNIEIADGTDPNEIKKLFEQQSENLAGLEIDDIVINLRVEGLIHAHSTLLPKEPRRVQVNDNDRRCDDIPTLHDSVKERFNEVEYYRPTTLRGLKFKLYGEKLSDTITGVNGLRKG